MFLLFESLIRVNDHKLAEFFELNATRLVLVHLSHDSLKLFLLDKYLQLGEHTSQLVQGYRSSIIFVESSEHVSQNILLLFVVWNCQQSLSHKFNNLHNWVHFYRRICLFSNTPIVLHWLHKCLVIWDNHRNFSVDLKELIDWNFTFKVTSHGIFKWVQSWLHFFFVQ